MKAEIKKVNVEDNPASDLVYGVVLEVGEEGFDVYWDILEKLGFKLRNWEDDTIIIYSPKLKIK